ncbi:MAG: YicC/YloC family endoribonuclease, partial [bacterium]|nr:YicC/YloC family endoribonuclease [bacterium]
MLKSMTGYGSAMGVVGSHRLSVEVKSVNHKYCEVNFRIASAYASLESRVVEMAKNHFKRGRIDVFVRGDYQNGLGAPLHLDVKKLKNFHGELIKASKALKISPNIDLNTLLAFPQMVMVEEEEDLNRFWKGLEALLKKAFSNLEKMRNREGKGISSFLMEQLKFLAKEVKWIEGKVPKTVQGHQEHLEDRIKKITQNLELDPIRLAQEVAYFVDRTDISEELQRLDDHI